MAWFAPTVSVPPTWKASAAVPKSASVGALDDSNAVIVFVPDVRVIAVVGTVITAVVAAAPEIEN